MKEKQQGGGYGYGGGYSGNTGGYSYGGSHGFGQNESPKMQAAANYIASRHYAEALNVLNGIPFGERRARWYYFSAIANQGMGNNINAMEHAKRAVEMEPPPRQQRTPCLLPLRALLLLWRSRREDWSVQKSAG